MTNTTTQVLIVEDDTAIRLMLSSYFSNEGYAVFEAATTQEAEAITSKNDIQLALIDILLKDGDGLELTRNLRATSDIGIILITSKRDEIDRIIGLEMGADAYICKPFNTREILAYAKNILRRVRHHNSKRPHSNRYMFGNWSLDAAKRKLINLKTKKHEPLTRDEFFLLRAFLENSGEILSRDQLLNLMHGHDWLANDRTIDILVGRLRKKLQDKSRQNHITTVYGQGYLFEFDVQHETSDSA